MRRVIDIAPGCATLDPRDALRVNPDTAHVREVNHQPAIIHREPRDVVAAAAHRDAQFRLTPEIDRADDIGDIGAADDDRGMAVDHRVVDMTRLFV